MGENNTVSVLIYGQEYNFSSADMPREYVMKLADKVDAAMRELGAGKNQSLTKTAVIAAMSIASDYYDARKDRDELLVKNSELSEKAINYENLWDEVKRSFENYKNEQESKIKALEERIDEQNIYINNSKEIPDEVQKHINDLETKCRDIESSFFDLQMENIRLKEEVNKYKNNY